MKYPYTFKKLCLLVLRPSLFLPDNRPLVINTVSALRSPGECEPNQSQRNSWIPLYSGPNLAFLRDSSGISHYEFDFKSLRQAQESPSVLALLVNANSKLQNVKELNLQPVVQQIARAVEQAIALIFHVPKEVRDQNPSLIPPVPDLPSAYYPSVGTPGTPSGSGIESNVIEGQPSMGLDRQSGIVEEDHSDLANYYEDDDLVEDDDTINGLTIPEMKAVLQRVSDGTISDSQRGEAAMLMLGMAGGKLLLIRSILLFLIPDAARSSTSPGALSVNHRFRIATEGYLMDAR